MITSNHSALLTATLGDDAELRTVTAAQVRALARRRRRGRVVRRVAAPTVAVLLAALAVVLFRTGPAPTEPAVSTVRTEPLAVDVVVRTAPVGELRLVSTQAGQFDLRRTDPLRLHLDYLDDAGLRTLLAEHRAALIVPGGQPARVVLP